MDDRQKRLTSSAGTGEFASGERIDGMSYTGSSTFTADRPRVYKAANIQFDAVYNKVGYHFPQARILALWEDAWPVINKQRPPEPLVMRMNTFDCVQYQQTNLVPATYEMDDYQVRTPTDVIGQHIHLPKWDLVSADGSANGWNYEDGVLSPERCKNVSMPFASSTSAKAPTRVTARQPVRKPKITRTSVNLAGPTGSGRARQCSAGLSIRW